VLIDEDSTPSSMRDALGYAIEPAAGTRTERVAKRERIERTRPARG
jgi:hypothetical protein